MSQKRVIVISGVSGAGKSTLSRLLLDEFGKNISEVVSHTTRPPRESELDGIDYHFVSTDVFNDMRQRGLFIEYVECFGNYYGTSVSVIDSSLKTRHTCLMDIEWQGAYSVLHGGLLTDLLKIGILILPPSMKILRERLQNRKSETEETLDRRICESFKVDCIASYKHIIVNDDLNTAYTELRAIYLGEDSGLWK